MAACADDLCAGLLLKGQVETLAAACSIIWNMHTLCLMVIMGPAGCDGYMFGGHCCTIW